MTFQKYIYEIAFPLLCCLLINCNPMDSSDICDPASKLFYRTVLLKTGSGDKNSFCGLPGSNPMNSGTQTIALRIKQPKFVYVANAGTPNVSAYTINATTGSLSPVPGSPFAVLTGSNVRFVAANPDGTFLFAASGSFIAAFSVNTSTGVLSLIAGSPFSSPSSPYTLAIDPSGKYLVAGPDAAASIYVYSINSTTGALNQIGTYGAAGNPGSANFDPTGKYVYAGLIGNPGNVEAWSMDSSGNLTHIPSAPFAGGNDAISTAVDPGGRFLYAANYFTNSIYSYTMDSTTGILSTIAGSPFAAGAAPGYVVVDAKSRFVYEANSGDAVGTAAISAFTINSANGALTQIAGSPFSSGLNPIGLATDPTGAFLFCANTASNSLSAFTINQSTGAPVPVSGSPFATGTQPFAVTVVSY